MSIFVLYRAIIEYIFAISHPVLAELLSSISHFVFILYYLGYKRGKRYTYHYEAIIAHGIPDAFKNDMALVVKATAHLDYLESTADVVLKVAIDFYGVLSSRFLFLLTKKVSQRSQTNYHADMHAFFCHSSFLRTQKNF